MNIDSTDRRGFIAFMVIAALLAAVGNALVYLLGWSAPQRGATVPPGWEWVDRVVGFVWVVLFSGMGVATWLLYRSPSPAGAMHARLVICLLVACLLYPLYTLGFRPVPGLMGNVAVLAMTVALAAIVWRSSRAAALLLVPVAAWIAVATVYVGKLILINRS